MLRGTRAGFRRIVLSRLEEQSRRAARNGVPHRLGGAVVAQPLARQAESGGPPGQGPRDPGRGARPVGSHRGGAARVARRVRRAPPGGDPGGATLERRRVCAHIPPDVSPRRGPLHLSPRPARHPATPAGPPAALPRAGSVLSPRSFMRCISLVLLAVCLTPPVDALGDPGLLADRSLTNSGGHL